MATVLSITTDQTDARPTQVPTDNPAAAPVPVVDTPLPPYTLGFDLTQIEDGYLQRRTSRGRNTVALIQGRVHGQYLPDIIVDTGANSNVVVTSQFLRVLEPARSTSKPTPPLASSMALVVAALSVAIAVSPLAVLTPLVALQL